LDFANERYIRIYLRDTTTWKRLGWDGTCVLMHVLRKMDLSGVLDLEDLEPWEAAVLHCGAPESAARDGMARCLALGCFVHHDRHLVAPKYRAANEAIKSDRQRALEARSRRRSEALGPRDEASRNVTHPSDGFALIPSDGPGHGVTARDAFVTKRDGSSRNVTPRHETNDFVTAGHTASRRVTPTGSDPDPDPDPVPEPIRGGARGRARGSHPPVVSDLEEQDQAAGLLAALELDWERIAGTGISDRERQQLRELLTTSPLVIDRDARGTFERAAQAFVADCRDRGKRPVLGWLVAQFDEWAEPVRRGEGDALRESPADRSARERREAEERELEERERRDAEQRRRDAEPSQRPDAMPGETRGEYYARKLREVDEHAHGSPKLTEPPAPPAPEPAPSGRAAPPLTPEQLAVRDAKAALRAARDRGADEGELAALRAAVRATERAALNAQRGAEGLPPLEET
jgi:hypothetical protein